jgi:hypothetical protein
MKRRLKQDLTSSSYLEQFGTECARKRAPEIRSGAIGFGLSMPLDDLRLNHFIHQTIRVMEGAEKLDWAHTPTARRRVFVLAMLTEWQHLGIAPLDLALTD